MHFQSSDQKFDIVPKHTFDLVKFDLVIISHMNLFLIYLFSALPGGKLDLC
jgi:hypothetical protein